MTRRKIKKALTMKILDEATLTYRTVNLYNVVFSHRNGISTLDVQVYSPNDAEVFAVANRLYRGQGAFGEAISFHRAS